MKRRNFIAGLFAAPAVVAVAGPAVAKAVATPKASALEADYTRKTAALAAERARSGFTADELRTVSDAIVEHYSTHNQSLFSKYDTVGYRTYFLTDRGVRVA